MLGLKSTSSFLSDRFPDEPHSEEIVSHIGGGSGGYLEHIARYASNILGGQSLDQLQYKVLRSVFTGSHRNLSRDIRKSAFCICENKGANQLNVSNCAADQRLCFRYMHVDCTVPLPSKSKT